MAHSTTKILVDPNADFVVWAVGLVEQNVRTFYGSAWSRIKKKRELTILGMLFFAHFMDDLQVAFAAVLPDHEPYINESQRKVLYVYELQVAEEHQGQGVGSVLINEIVNYAKKMSIKWILLTHYSANKRAERFYQKHGFTLDWSTPTDAPFVILSRQLD